MTKDIPILSSKLMPPRITDTIVREKLRPLTAKIPEKKVSTVMAGAGYGKTTLIAQAVEGYDTAWYRLDDLDRDFATFMSHLVTGIRRLYPDFGRETEKRLEEGGTLGLEYRGVAALFVHELTRALDRDLMIVLDDYHAVEDSPLIRDTVQFLAEFLCPAAHLIIASRTEVSLRLSRLRIMREVLDITQEDLLFSAPEIRQLLEMLLGTDISEGSLEMLQAKTSGWISALILFFHSVGGKGGIDIEEEVDRLKGSGRLISKYLAENVFAQLRGELREFLLKTSILSRLNAPFCNRLLGISHAGEILASLQKDHLFTYALDEDGQDYCYHQLFREYLQAALIREMGSAEEGRLHREAARILEEGGDDEDALRHYLKAGAFEQACVVLERLTMPLIGSGRNELMQAFLENIPEPFFLKHPWLEYLRGFTFIFSGRFVEAGNFFLKALVMFKEKGDRQGVDRCLDVMATGLYLKGDFSTARDIFEELLRSPSLSPVLRAEVFIHLMFIFTQTGNMEESDRYYNQALLSMQDIEEFEMREVLHACLLIFHGFRHVFSGNMYRAIDLAEVAKEKLRKVGNDRFLIYGYQLTSMACSYLGLNDAGFEEARKGLELSKDKGFRDFSYAWTLCNAGVLACGKGRMAEGMQYAEDGLRLFRELGSNFGEGCADLSLGYISLYSGRPDQAEGMAEACLKAVRGLDLPFVAGSAKVLQAYALLVKGGLDEAERLLGEAHAVFSFSTHFDCTASGMRARISWQRGRVEDALAHLHQCLRIAEVNGFLRVVAQEWVWLMLPLVMLYARGIMQGGIREIFGIAGEDARAGLMGLQRHVAGQEAQAVVEILKSLPEAPRPGLKVRCLGRFQVFRGQEEIPAEQWKSSRSKMLFKLLVHYRGRGFVNKEVFIEHLWPEDDPGKTSTRFHVALTTLRRILEPGLKRGHASAYLKSDGDAYLLDLGRDGSVDLEIFEEACGKASRELEAAGAGEVFFETERFYQGDFLAEDPYEPWCMEERDRIKGLYLAVLAGIIDFLSTRREYAQAIDYCNKYLAIDAYAEDIYQRLMNLFALSGNNSMVLKTYDRCRDQVAGDLGCPLSRKTESLARELLAGSGVGPG
jgi:LuxR family transcriptional regulator, maltose regulon positive regulatory protein